MLFNKSAASNNNSDVSAAFDTSILEAVNKYKLVFKVELNANPTKVNLKKKAGEYKEGGVVTNLGGCGRLTRNTNDDNVFINMNLRPKIKDESLGTIVNPDFILPIFHLKMDQDPQIAAMNAYLQSVGMAPVPSSSLLKEDFVSSSKLAHILDINFGTPEVELYFNGVQKYLSEDTIDLMESERGLLTIYFVMEVHSPREPKPKAKNQLQVNNLVKQSDDKNKSKQYNSYLIGAEFEAGKTASVIRPKKVTPAARVEAALSILSSNEFDDLLDANGNIELSESIYTKIAAERDAFLDSVGTGKKAHKEFKEALELSVANGQWDKDAEYKLYAIARRGLNIHYTMKNHDIFIAKMKQVVGSDPIVINEPLVAPKVEEPKTNPIASSVVMEDEDEEDFGFVPNIPLPSVASVVEDDDVDIVI